jgi:hypothetical protein
MKIPVNAKKTKIKPINNRWDLGLADGLILVGKAKSSFQPDQIL